MTTSEEVNGKSQVEARGHMKSSNIKRAAWDSSEAPKRYRRGLYLTITVIILAWCWTVTTSLLFQDDLAAIGETFWGLFNAAMIYGTVVLVIIWSLLRVTGEGVSAIGLTTRRLWRRLGFGVALGIAMFVLVTFFLHPVAAAIIPSSSTDVDLGRLLTNPWHLPFWIILCIVKGGLSEELWRAFSLDRFERCFGRPGLVVAIVVGSLAFAMGHLYQGGDSVITAVVTSLIYAGVYIARRSAVEICAAHAIRDIVSVVVGYLIF